MLAESPVQLNGTFADNTIVIFTTDNGAEVFTWPDGGMTPFRATKGTVFEGGFRVPAIIRWPGKVPPGREYIAFVSTLIQEVARERCGLDVSVVYGGGLKEENAAMIASIPTLGGGLVGLTRFTGEIGFEVEGLAGIIRKYRES